MAGEISWGCGPSQEIDLSPQYQNRQYSPERYRALEKLTLDYFTSLSAWCRVLCGGHPTGHETGKHTPEEPTKLAPLIWDSIRMPALKSLGDIRGYQRSLEVAALAISPCSSFLQSGGSVCPPTLRSAGQRQGHVSRPHTLSSIGVALSELLQTRDYCRTIENSALHITSSSAWWWLIFRRSLQAPGVGSSSVSRPRSIRRRESQPHREVYWQISENNYPEPTEQAIRHRIESASLRMTLDAVHSHPRLGATLQG